MYLSRAETRIETRSMAGHRLHVFAVPQEVAQEIGNERDGNISKSVVQASNSNEQGCGASATAHGWENEEGAKA